MNQLQSFFRMFEEIIFSVERCIEKKSVSLSHPAGEIAGLDKKAFFALSLVSKSPISRGRIGTM